MSWPFAQEEDAGDWGDLPNGGKDGLFLVVLSLGWWIDVRDPSDTGGEGAWKPMKTS